MIRRLFFFALSAMMLLVACEDNDSFSADSANRLTFAADTVRLDTLFSTVPSSTYAFWVHNQTGSGIRISTVRLERGNQSGYRVNVDGSYVDPVASDLEVRKGDSILVFVEITTRENHAQEPQLVEDNLLFTLESGVVQRVNLRTYSWDAQKIGSLMISRDTVIETSVPLLVYDSIFVDSAATLTLRNTELYFHNGAGITVCGQLVAEGCLFRGDRLDHMFDYLPYDRISGQWRGIRIEHSSVYNELTNCIIRNAEDAVCCDSTQLLMTGCTVHNSKGVGVKGTNADVTLRYCMLTNTLGDCLSVSGGVVIIDHCTLAQFYPFSANRGAALRFTNSSRGLYIHCTRTLVTGYETDVVMGEQTDTLTAYELHFADCLLRTDSVVDSLRFERIVWETPKDSVQGKQHFRTVDEDNLYYDFRLDSISPALSLGIGCIVENEEIMNARHR